jgi:hypothetical protein
MLPQSLQLNFSCSCINHHVADQAIITLGPAPTSVKVAAAVPLVTRSASGSAGRLQCSQVCLQVSKLCTALIHDLQAGSCCNILNLRHVPVDRALLLLLLQK